MGQVPEEQKELTVEASPLNVQPPYLPPKSHLGLIYSVQLSKTERIRICSWNLHYNYNWDLGIPEIPIYGHAEYSADVVIKTLKKVISTDDPPVILAFPYMAGETEKLLRRDLNNGSRGPWKVCSLELGMTVYNSDRLRCLGNSSDDRTVTSFALNFGSNHRFNLVNMHRELQEDHKQSIDKFTAYLLALDHELPDASTNIVVGTANLEMALIDNRGCYYVPTAAQAPNFCIKTNLLDKPVLQAQVPKTMDVCMVRHQTETAYQLITPFMVMVKSDEPLSEPKWKYIPSLADDSLKRYSAHALETTISAHVTQLKTWIEDMRRSRGTRLAGLFFVQFDENEFLTTLSRSIDSKEWRQLINLTDQIINSDGTELRQPPSISIPSAEGPGPSPEEIQFHLRLKGEGFLGVKVGFYANQLGKRYLRLSSPSVLRLDVLPEPKLNISHEKTIGYYYYLAPIQAHLFQLTLNEKMLFASSQLLDYLKGKCSTAPNYAGLVLAIEAYTRTVCDYLSKKIDSRLFKERLWEQELELFQQTLAIQNSPRDTAETIQNIRLFLRHISLCLGPFLKDIAIGAAFGVFAGGCIGFAPAGAAVSGAIIGGGVGFFKAYKKHYPRAKRDVLKEDAQKVSFMNQFVKTSEGLFSKFLENECSPSLVTKDSKATF